MPRQPNKKIGEAEKLYKSGMKMVDISKKIGVPEGTIRRWKHDKCWDGNTKKKQSERSEKRDEEKANVRKRGAPKGNQNAKGGKGNPNPKPPPDPTKHGAYRAVFMDALDEDEQELVGMVPEDEEQLLIEQIQLFSIRERRILKAINKYRGQNGDVAVADVTRFEEKRAFKDKEEEAEYERRQQEKVNKEKRLPGKSYSIQTHTSNKDLIIARLEQELSTVQSKKTKAIEALSKERLEKAKMERETAGNAAVDDWISAVIEEDSEYGQE